ncbi:MAG TPA: molecular chaperone DnaJ [Microthrixaceae bacterium]|nr:molecular chaperone DnaJ [Microthrixaceae bacterium]MCB9375867.1 molecular chaperone DnaJ [Microthrixaceae bacterium]MCB9401001.1 molecular chaperone DnaJ [Microthrixaceae bacterium]MCO5305269.1 molecular chaperone DnaJ [Microthrixaceae bacterium]HMV74315.1 molecular chaperone DnaJ [Microthrixaceae bacterium]
MSSPQREWFEKNYYAVLGVSETAAQKDITKAYRQLARQLHPDANPDDPVAEERFKEVSAAYEVVGDPDKREQYDEVRRMGPVGAGFGGPGGFGPGGARFEGADLSDLIGNLFSRGRQRGGGPQAASTGPRRGSDIEATLTMTFDDAARGATTTVNVVSDIRCPDCFGSGAAVGTAPLSCPDCGGTGAVAEDQGFFSFSSPCPRCGGRGRIIEQPCTTCSGLGSVRRPRQVKVRIPQGVRDGQRIRVKGRGGAGANGGPDGDLYVRVQVEPHPLYGRDGDNLLLSVPVTYPEAALGADVTVPTLDGDAVTIRVPAGTRSGRTFRVRGKGVATPKTTGDLLVTIEIDVPTEIGDDERVALEALAAARTGPSPRAHLEV